MQTIEVILTILTYISAFILTYFSVLLILVYIQNMEKIRSYRGSRKWEPKVSVVIPSYNEERLVGRCIESVLNLEYPKNKLEIIVVDDCSTDKTFEIAKRYEKYGVKVIQTPKNGGIAAKTKNYGAKYATGEVLGFLDSDSIVMPDALRKMLPYFEEGVGAVTASVRVWNPKTIMEKLQYIEYETILFLRRVFMSAEAVYVTPGPFSLFLRDAFKEIEGYDEGSLTEDHEIALHLQAKGYKIRSTWDATVLTDAPKTIREWIKQRTRWLRGSLYNRIKHYYLLNFFKYGDFGFMAMTFDTILFIPIALMIIAPPLRIIFRDHWMERVGLFTVLGSLDPLFIIGTLVTIVSMVWLYHMWKTMERYTIKYKIEWWIWPLYLFVYSVAWAYIWVFVLWKEITFQKRTWDTR